MRQCSSHNSHQQLSYSLCCHRQLQKIPRKEANMLIELNEEQSYMLQREFHVTPTCFRMITQLINTAECLPSLQAAGMNERQKQIGEPHQHTFEWIFSDAKAGFHQWLQSDSGLFWVKGKPGSGKSTLMKYILKDSRTRKALEMKYGSQSLTMPGFFFHSRGKVD